MSEFKVKMHQIRFWLGLCPRPRLGILHRSPDPLAGFEGPTSKGREGGKREGMRVEAREGRGKGRGGKRREGRGSLFGNVAEEAFCLKSARVLGVRLNCDQQDANSTRTLCNDPGHTILL